jgi:hypothetical protein
MTDSEIAKIAERQNMLNAIGILEDENAKLSRRLTGVKNLLEDLRNGTQDPPDARECSVCGRVPMKAFVNLVDPQWSGLRAWIGRMDDVLGRSMS